MASEDASLLDQLDAVAPVPLAQFDAFPKLPSTYKSRSGSLGFLTIAVTFATLLLLMNDVGELLWGWPDYEFSVDAGRTSYMNINLDMIVNMPCHTLSVDLRDSLGDRLYLSNENGAASFMRESTSFDIGHATQMRQHAADLSASQAVAQSRKSRGIFAWLRSLRKVPNAKFKKTRKPFEGEKEACRIFGSLEVRKVTANLHITALGHGYASSTHTDHNLMNMSHIISEFSFGPFFPDIVQPLDNSVEITHQPFAAIQYYLHVVPTTFIAPRTTPLRTHQYSVTHYTRTLAYHSGTPGIYFKFEMEPVQLTIIQRTTTFTKFFVRVAGVIGGVFVCMGYAIRFTNRAVNAYIGIDSDANAGPIGAEASGASRLQGKWGGGALRSRMSETSRVVRQGNSWVVEGSPNAGGSPYGMPASGLTYTPGHTPSPSIYVASPGASPYTPTSATLGSAPGTPYGLGFAPGSASAYAGGHSRQSSHSLVPSPYTPTSPYVPTVPGLNGLDHPTSPNMQATHANGAGGPHPPPGRNSSLSGGKKDD